MKRTILTCILLLILLPFAQSAEKPGLNYKFYKEQIGEHLRTQMCVGLENGKECRLPPKIKAKVDSVCCQGSCKLGVKTCSEEEPDINLFLALKKMACRGKTQNETCTVKIKKHFSIDGVCCNQVCELGKNSCLGEEIEEPGEYQQNKKEFDKQEDLEKLANELKVLSCLGVENGKKCIIPEKIKSEYNLRGVCCKEICLFRKQECPENLKQSSTTTTQEKSSEEKDLPFALLLIIILLILLLVGIVLYNNNRQKKTIQEEIKKAQDPDYENKLKNLQEEKESIEKRIRLAKLKFHKRKLDEESFREIVRDHQKRIIEIEAKMKEIESRVEKLEENSDL